MSAEALRYLASSRGTPVAPPPHGIFLSPGQQPRAPENAGALVPATLPPLPPPSGPLMEHFRGLPPGLQPIGFYPPCLGGPSLSLDMKNDPLSNALTHGQPILPPAFYYDPCFSSAYPYHDRFAGSLDINSARRKNATRETTAPLKAWLYEHRKNPYPTKHEKVFLAVITKMTITQVSTWFANARRRLKKENKMTWSPRNRSGDDEDDDDDDEHNDEPNQTGVDSSERPLSSQSSLLDTHDMDGLDNEHSEKSIHHPGDTAAPSTTNCKIGEQPSIQRHTAYPSDSAHSSEYGRGSERHAEKRKANGTGNDDASVSSADQSLLSSPSKKPKIWSIADTVNLPTDTDSSKAASVDQSDRTTLGASTRLLSSHSDDSPSSKSHGHPMTSSANAGPFNFTFPPFNAQVAAAMLPRAAHLAGLGGSPAGAAQTQAQVQPVPPFFGLSPTAVMMMPRPELLYRNFLTPLQHQHGPLNLAALISAGSGVNPFNFYQPPTGSGSTCTTAEKNSDKQTPAQQPSISSTSAVVSPISSANSTQSSSPNQNMTAEHRNSSK